MAIDGEDDIAVVVANAVANILTVLHEFIYYLFEKNDKNVRALITIHHCSYLPRGWVSVFIYFRLSLLIGSIWWILLMLFGVFPKTSSKTSSEPSRGVGFLRFHTMWNVA